MGNGASHKAGKTRPDFFGEDTFKKIAGKVVNPLIETSSNLKRKISETGSKLKRKLRRVKRGNKSRHLIPKEELDKLHRLLRAQFGTDRYSFRKLKKNRKNKNRKNKNKRRSHKRVHFD